MIVVFDKQYLKDLYEKGKTRDKSYRFQPEIVRGYIKGVSFLLKADDIKDLLNIRGLNYEVLKGNKQGISSIRINDKYRLEFKVTTYKDGILIKICNILDISNHYK